MGPADELVPVLKKLRLSGVLLSLDVRLRQAAEGELSHTEFLLRVLTDEVDRRDGKQVDLRLRRASFEHRKTLEDFDFQFNQKLPRSKLLELSTCTFVGKKENVAIIGPTGTGKSHVAQAIGHRACMAGYTTLFIAAHRLHDELRGARADGSYDKRLQRFTAPDLLIVDDLGLRPLRDGEPLDLYDIIRGRYERSATIVTSNRAIDEWYPLFGDPLLASAAMDRLLHHAHVVEMTGRSFRTGAQDLRGGAAPA
jgi:DNA replication protein DnaC